MLVLFSLVILSCSINSIWTATPFKDCGSEAGTIQAFEVTNCTAAPCKLVRGHSYAMNLTFQAKAPSAAVSVVIHGIIGGIPVPFPLPESDACKLGVKCPVAQNDINIGTLTIPVESSYPSISLYVKIELKATDQNQDYVCLEFPASIVSGIKEAHNLVGWEQGKLFEKLN